MPANIAPRVLAARRSLGRLSRRPNETAANSTTPTAAMATNRPRHEVTRNNWPPTNGASTGTTRLTRTSRENTRAASRPLK